MAVYPWPVRLKKCCLLGLLLVVGYPLQSCAFRPILDPNQASRLIYLSSRGHSKNLPKPLGDRIISTSTSTTTQLQAFVAEESILLTQFALAGTLGVATDPLAELMFEKNPEWCKDVDIETTFLYGAADSISNAARVYAGLVFIAFLGNWFQLSFVPTSLATSAAPIALTVWFALTLGTAKRTLFLQKVAGNKLGRVRLYDQLIDFVLWIVTAAVILSELDVDIGMGFQSIFAASGIGALIFSLASKDLAEQIVGGIILQAWDAFDVGDDVLLGDGTEGTIRKIGLVETEIAGYDNIVVKLPNSQLTNQRISNISRTNQSRVRETLRFSYSDIDKMPEILADIKEEIRSSCPGLITDGSKPFTAVLDSYQDDHIKVVVNCHFNLQPFCDEYIATKEEMLLAIARAVSKNKVKFAIPAVNYVNR